MILFPRILLFTAGLVWLAGCSAITPHSAASGDGGQSSEERQRLVMTWVPPYAVEVCQQRLNEDFGDIGMADGLSHVGLQFWIPTPEGGLRRAGRTNQTTDAAIRWFRDWGRKNDIKVLLCVFNGGRTWDWSLAQAGFARHPDQFIEALLTEVERLDLDGVDIDLEGGSEFQSDREAFVAFVERLSNRLDERGLELTVDSFAYKWNAPNQSWWPELFPHVDGLTTMGYAQTGSGAPGWRSYGFQQKAAGDFAHKLMIGFPSHQDEWQGQPLMDQLEWIRTNGVVGMSLWDAQLRSPAWRQPEVWKTIKEIRDGHGSDPHRSAASTPGSRGNRRP